MFNTRNKSGISMHPCIILSLYIYTYVRQCIFTAVYTIHQAKAILTIELQDLSSKYAEEIH